MKKSRLPNPFFAGENQRLTREWGNQSPKRIVKRLYPCFSSTFRGQFSFPGSSQLVTVSSPFLRNPCGNTPCACASQPHYGGTSTVSLQSRRGNQTNQGNHDTGGSRKLFLPTQSLMLNTPAQRSGGLSMMVSSPSDWHHCVDQWTLQMSLFTMKMKANFV